MREPMSTKVVRPARPDGSSTGGGITEQRFLVKDWSDTPDVLACRTWDGDTEGESLILVALPFLLRKTPFHQRTVNGYTYAYQSNVARKSTNASDASDFHLQMLTPDFYVDVEITARRGIFGGTGVQVAGGGAVVWLLNNDDAREWSNIE